MITFFKSIPRDILIAGSIVLVIAFIAVYQWGYINGEKSRS